MRGFAVDVAEVEAVVSGLTATQGRLEAIADDLDARVSALHQHWDGRAATAHEAAHRRWRAGLDELRAALERLSAAGGDAAASYRTASEDNVAMWGQL